MEQALCGLRLLGMKRTVTRTLFSLILLLAAAAPAAAQGGDYSWRALYQGDLAGQSVQLDLTLGANDVAFARLTQAGSVVVLAGAGTHEQDGTFAVTLHAVPLNEAPSSAIYLPEPNGAEDAGDLPEPAARLLGTRSLDWDDDGTTLSVQLERLDAASGSAAQTGTLERVAQYAFGSLVEGRIDVSYAYPRFTDGVAGLNALLERAATQRMAEWVDEGRSMVDAGEGLGWAWTHHEAVDLVGAAGDLRSLLVTFDYFTGGAHPNSHSESLLVEASGADVLLVGLEELFAPDADWLSAVVTGVLGDLAAQKADAVISGEITDLTVEDLSTFTLGPDGLSFHFDPYAVGPYVQGSFTATLGYGEVAHLAAPGGALQAFADAYQTR